jgi:hypothetical protein
MTSRQSQIGLNSSAATLGAPHAQHKITFAWPEGLVASLGVMLPPTKERSSFRQPTRPAGQGATGLSANRKVQNNGIAIPARGTLSNDNNNNAAAAD